MDNNATTTTENVTPLMEDDGTVIEHVDENGHTVKVENTNTASTEETTTDTSTSDSKQSENTQETEVKKDESTENESTPTTDSNTEKVEETVSETTHESTNETVNNSTSTTENETVTQTPSNEETTTTPTEDVKATDEVKEEVETHPYVSFGVPSPEKVDIFIKRIKKANLLSELKKTEDGEYILGPYNNLEEAYQARKQIIRKGLRGKIIEF